MYVKNGIAYAEKRSKSEYLAMGYSESAADYFCGERRTIIKLIPNDDFTITLFFDNGEKRLLNVEPWLEKGTVFEAICEIGNFKRAYLDEENCVSWDINPDIDSKEVWNNKIDLCPDTCYIESTAID